MTSDDILALFTHSDGYRCARWGRPIVPVVFGVEDETLALVKGGIEAVVAGAGHRMAEQDPELGANLMIFFFAEWAELRTVPDLERMVPDLDALSGGETARLFRFDAAGAIRMAALFVRMGGPLAALPPEALVLEQAARMMLTWAGEPPMLEDGALRPEIAAVLRAAYDPVMPARGDDPSHALRLAARA
ncbi:hypothetical protein [Falsirhodobacter algicola]|uniref:Uncharacterized protein n=1 Tax=Falsirhodobacter algicola TaxID=2692330 RepID=A0A8J8MU49_9RHOB|nr:hypothetical protein [Falsirhodobacter algicola]QUS36795.1 hypothetical protein GR316_11285 [Falsirhodobacter algicola]